MLNKIWDRQLFLTLVGVIAFLCLLTAFIAEYGFGIIPCHLCLYERYVYGALGVLGVVSAFHFSPFLFNLTGFIILGGLGLAIYHLGVESHWWQAPHACLSPPLAAGNFEDFKSHFMKKSTARCDQINWVIFGVSATIWNVVFFCSLGLSLFLVKFKSPR